MKRDWIILACGAAAIGALGWSGDNYFIRLLTILCMYATLAQSWNFIGGFAGYPSFGTAAFFGLGAYTSGVLQNQGLPILMCWGLAGLCAAMFAILVGGAILHLRGHYFAIATLIIAEMLREIVNTTPNLTGGGMGLNLPILRISVDVQSKVFLLAMLVLAVVTTATTIILQRSRLGFGLRCIQQNESAASILGVNAYQYKTAAFGLSAVFVGIAGAIYASWVNYIEPPDVFDILIAVKPLVMVLLGGIGTIFGPIIGAMALLALEELVWRNFLTVHAAALGVIIILLVMFLPNGLFSLFKGFSSKRAKQ